MKKKIHVTFSKASFVNKGIFTFCLAVFKAVVVLLVVFFL